MPGSAFEDEPVNLIEEEELDAKIAYRERQEELDREFRELKAKADELLAEMRRNENI